MVTQLSLRNLVLGTTIFNLTPQFQNPSRIETMRNDFLHRMGARLRHGLFVAAINTFLVGATRNVTLAQASTDFGVIERRAAEAAITRAIGTGAPKLRIVIDPMMVYPNEAPGGRDSAARNEMRNRSLAQSIGASTQRRNAVINCSERPCTLRNADLLVTLSTPSVTDSYATVTVTTVRRTTRGIQYRTVNVHLKKTGSDWNVARFDDLGIS